jgi:hypothetical protein
LIIRALGECHRVGYRSASKGLAAASATRFAFRHPKTAADSSTAATLAGTIAAIAGFYSVTEPKKIDFSWQLGEFTGLSGFWVPGYLYKQSP